MWFLLATYLIGQVALQGTSWGAVLTEAALAGCVTSQAARDMTAWSWVPAGKSYDGYDGTGKDEAAAGKMACQAQQIRHPTRTAWSQ